MRTKSLESPENRKFVETAERVEPARNLSPAARRALAEAAERRAAKPQESPGEEIGGRGGLEPTRYGDWERKGLASDF